LSHAAVVALIKTGQSFPFRNCDSKVMSLSSTRTTVECSKTFFKQDVDVLNGLSLSVKAVNLSSK